MLYVFLRVTYLLSCCCRWHCVRHGQNHDAAGVRTTATSSQVPSCCLQQVSHWQLLLVIICICMKSVIDWCDCVTCECAVWCSGCCLGKLCSLSFCPAWKQHVPHTRECHKCIHVTVCLWAHYCFCTDFSGKWKWLKSCRTDDSYDMQPSSIIHVCCRLLAQRAWNTTVRRSELQNKKLNLYQSHSWQDVIFVTSFGEVR